MQRSGSRWERARGSFAVAVDSLLNGSILRDKFARKVLFETTRYPVLRFQLDSLAGVQPGDTLRADAHGIFELRGVRMPVVVAVKAWPDGSGLRVVGQTSMPVVDLVDRFGMSAIALGMGGASRRWRRVHWGVDVVLRRAAG